MDQRDVSNGFCKEANIICYHPTNQEKTANLTSIHKSKYQLQYYVVLTSSHLSKIKGTIAQQFFKAGLCFVVSYHLFLISEIQSLAEQNMSCKL
uniref:Uncharacterized protein n=1 Tax=Electrophorus electricus TaxID=8005 RepID=A0A4W4GSY5_ELEEL